MKTLFFIFALLIIIGGATNIVFASHEPKLTLFGKTIDCYPSHPPTPPTQGGCDIADFADLLRIIINFLTIIVIPIATAMIIWGGIVIMTAGGSQDRVAKGKKVITTAVIGVAIALGSWLIINAIYLALTGAGAP